MRKAIITGSFDPVTSGHEDLILRSAKMFDHVTVLVVGNTKKASGVFTLEERLELIRMTLSALPCDHADAVLYEGLTSDAAHELGAKFIVRGARSASDFDYEYNLSQIMKRFDSDLETVILPTSPALSAISSTYVRDLLKYGCDLGDAVPEACRERMLEIYHNKNK